MKLFSPASLFKGIIILIALGSFAGLFWLPQVEGRATNLDLISIYSDPFIIYIYITSTAFFASLFYSYRLLQLIGSNNVFSQEATQVVRNIKYCAVVMICFVLVAEIYLFIVMRGKDDSAGGVMTGLMILFISMIVASCASVFQSIIQSRVDTK